ncbi:MAG: hypothetical protein JWR15_4730 [Prosthecobacter sp.]|nr:hypothetical protein [Prosthecobacter sp.]
MPFMIHRFIRSRVVAAVFSASLVVASVGNAHVVPDMTVEADFNAAGGYSLRINLDPRTFLADDPKSLPPVPGSWYRDMTPEQVAATHEKARQYLINSLGVLFNGQKTALPPCEIQAMDGADNTPLKAETQEVHLLATACGLLPVDAATFQIDFAKDANTSLILLHTQAGNKEIRPQVVFPGETSRPFQLRVVAAAAPPVAPAPPKASELYVIVALSLVCIACIIGWQLLNRYRHHHRAHRKPGDGRL